MVCQKSSLDMKIKNGLSKLLKELEKIEPLKWIRLMYLYPMGIDGQLIETVASSEKIVSYFDMPIQHINDKILKDMHRSNTKAHLFSCREAAFCYRRSCSANNYNSRLSRRNRLTI